MKRTLIVISCLLFLGYAANARADLTNLDLAFTAADQSLWGGGFSFGFEKEGRVGPWWIGIMYDVGLSTGTASGGFDGSLSIGHVSSMASPGYTPISMNFTGETNGGFIKSDLGAWLNLGWYIYINMPWPIPDIRYKDADAILSQDYGLNIYKQFTPQIGTAVSGDDDFAAYSLEAGWWKIGVGLDFLVTETDYFKATDITGQLKYQLSGTSEFGITDFAIGPSGAVTINANLSKSGTWDFSLLDLSLDNRFSPVFGLGLSPFIDYYFGTWSPGSISVDLLHVTPFELDFNELGRENAFSIVVEENTRVPEPSLMILLGISLMSVVGLKRWWKE